MIDMAKVNILPEVSAALASIVETVSRSVVEVRAGSRTLSSGFIWRPGLIVTADEALGESSSAAVIIAGVRHDASIAGRDPSTDIAVLKIEGETMPAATLVPDMSPKPGDLVLAIGRREQGATARLGIVSLAGGEWRSMRGGRIDSLIRLDLTLDRRGEGSLLVNAEGRAFGMAVRGPKRSVLAIPAPTIERIAARIVEKGSVRPGYLGLGLHPVRLHSGLSASGANPANGGLMVLGVAPDGPGARAGVLQGDIVTAWNGEAVASLRDVFRRLGPDAAGQTVELRLIRGGQPASVRCAVAERPLS
jgi:S1-C subfamily serine protease